MATPFDGKGLRKSNGKGESGQSSICGGDVFPVGCSNRRWGCLAGWAFGPECGSCLAVRRSRQRRRMKGAIADLVLQPEIGWISRHRRTISTTPPRVDVPAGTSTASAPGTGTSPSVLNRSAPPVKRFSTAKAARLRDPRQGAATAPAPVLADLRSPDGCPGVPGSGCAPVRPRMPALCATALVRRPWCDGPGAPGSGVVRIRRPRVIVGIPRRVAFDCHDVCHRYIT